MRIENRLITKRLPWHSNMTDMNHLGAMLAIKPEVFASKMTQLFTSQSYYSNNPLSAMMSEYANERTIDKSSWEWPLKAATTRPLVIMENVEPDSNTTPGKFKQDFKIKLDEPWWVPGDNITPGTSNKKYQLRIVESPVKNGTGWIYLVRGMWDDPAMYLPVRYLAQGQQWGKLFSQYEEGAEQSGSTQYSSPITLANRMSRFRKHYRVTGDAAQEVLAVKMQASDGKWYDSWIKYAEVEYWRQWYREIEKGYWYSRSTDTVMGAGGRPLYTGPGIQEQLEDSHIHRYSHLSARLIEEYLMDIFYSRIKPGAGREIVGFSGEYGMLNFHRAIQDLQEKRGFIQVVTDTFINKTRSEYHTNALSYGYQFTEYKMGNGITLKMVHNPLYDDREINFEIDPITGRPMESQRITFLDFSNGNNKNIELLTKRNSLKVGYVPGLQNPYGPANKSMMAHSGDYYEMHCQVQKGAHIEDVGRCGELILSRN